MANEEISKIEFYSILKKIQRSKLVKYTLGEKKQKSYNLVLVFTQLDHNMLNNSHTKE